MGSEKTVGVTQTGDVRNPTLRGARALSHRVAIRPGVEWRAARPVARLRPQSSRIDAPLAARQAVMSAYDLHSRGVEAALWTNIAAMLRRFAEVSGSTWAT